MNQETPGSGHRVTCLAIVALFLAGLTVVVDGSAVIVALPRIKIDLRFSDASLVWILNAYAATYGGFLILCGGLGDLFGHKRVFLFGTAVFTFASIGCAFSNSQESFISWRIVQGLGGSAIATTTFSLIVNTFQGGAARTKAMGIYAFTASSGGIVGLLLGGLLTDALDWHWIFLVNIPIGLIVFVTCAILLSDRSARPSNATVDLLGSIALTLALVIALFGIQQVRVGAWSKSQTASLWATAVAFLALFIHLESTARKPLVPREIFRLRNLMLCCVAGALSSLLGSAEVFASLYMQLVLERSPMEVGLTFILPSVVFAAFSLFISARLVICFGVKWPLLAGLLIGSLGLLLFTHTHVDGTLSRDVIPGLLVTALGSGMACNPILVAAMSEVRREDTGIASGLVTTCMLMGGALGITILASLSASYASHQLAAGADPTAALNSGYHVAFLLCAILNAAAIPFVLLLREIPARSDMGSALTGSPEVRAGD